jgi:dTDP-4-dehydrorhamnose 3,5-epimerase
VIQPKCFSDERGFLLESFHAERYREAGIVGTFVQDNHSRSRRHVLRGMHFQVKCPQAQIVTVIRGRVFLQIWLPPLAIRPISVSAA